MSLFCQLLLIFISIASLFQPTRMRIKRSDNNLVAEKIEEQMKCNTLMFTCWLLVIIYKRAPKYTAFIVFSFEHTIFFGWGIRECLLRKMLFYPFKKKNSLAFVWGENRCALCVGFERGEKKKQHQSNWRVKRNQRNNWNEVVS